MEKAIKENNEVISNLNKNNENKEENVIKNNKEENDKENIQEVNNVDIENIINNLYRIIQPPIVQQNIENNNVE